MAEPALQADVQLGAQGRLVVPAALRKALGFEAGEILLARVEDGRLVVEKAEAVERRIYERFEKVKGRSLADELIAERREEARREAGR
ncbi:MAG: AbrB/MazE/SpoVT family DNA-binding domain-containing protein [Gammaproteobacteria bacterium]|nr:AbrB/MazE/SpoVT family DNA-binding domain-containing protein [Gammaproteobacteria bacterium]MDJ0872428.1 AbrB/MazE/SpoVT family DNA-binding domain-containing protein [Gammaproteobacteria bacterium]MDJ0890512.1 AbrB/MazE/SpoVT family DNA-binding domain-containing protein [Gammaproteobacteria bacterium]